MEAQQSLSGPYSSLAGPSLIGDSGSEQTWHMSSSMHYACSSVMGCMEAHQSEGCAVLSRGRSRNFKRGGGVRQNFLQKGGGGGVQPLTREQFVLQINKIFSKRGGGGGRTPSTPLDLPLVSFLWFCRSFSDQGFWSFPCQISRQGCSVQHLMNDQGGISK